MTSRREARSGGPASLDESHEEPCQEADEEAFIKLSRRIWDDLKAEVQASYARMNKAA